MPKVQKEKKYEILRTDWIEIVDADHHKHVLHRIRAIKDFDDVKAGDYGGYVESEQNLNQYDNSWIYSDAVLISKNARAWGQSRVYGNAKLYNSTEVCDYAIVCDDVKLYENCKIHGRAKVYGKCCISGITDIGGRTELNGTFIRICDDVVICDNVKIVGRVDISGHTIIMGNTTIIGENITLLGNIIIREATNLRDNAYITSNKDFISVTNVGNTMDTLTSYLTKQKGIMFHFEENVYAYDDFRTMVGQEYDDTSSHKQELMDFSWIINQWFGYNR